MNEQEMQFADPDWEPTGPSPAQLGSAVASTPTPVSVAGPVNNQTYDARQPTSLPDYEQGYQGVWQQQPVMPPPPMQPLPQQGSYRPASAMRGRGRSRWWIWVVAVVLFFSLVSPISHSFQRGGSGSSTAFSVPHQAEGKQIYSMQGATELDINDLSGNVTVQVNTDGSQDVVVLAGDSSRPVANYQGQKMVLTSDNDMTIIVPQSIALNLSAGQGTLEVDGFSGQLTAQTNSGDITLNNDALSQGSSLNTNSGNIEQDQGSINGATVTSSTGQITLNQVNLSGQVTISTGGNGSINYTGGTLDPQGTYQFTTDSGDINLSLPQNTSMRMQIVQKSGHYNSDFPDSTGSAPQASVGIVTNSGNITISKQP